MTPRGMVFESFWFENEHTGFEQFWSESLKKV